MKLEELSDLNDSITQAGASSMWLHLAPYITSMILTDVLSNKSV